MARSVALVFLFRLDGLLLGGGFGTEVRTVLRDVGALLSSIGLLGGSSGLRLGLDGLGFCLGGSGLRLLGLGLGVEIGGLGERGRSGHQGGDHGRQHKLADIHLGTSPWWGVRMATAVLDHCRSPQRRRRTYRRRPCQILNNGTFTRPDFTPRYGSGHVRDRFHHRIVTVVQSASDLCFLDHPRCRPPFWRADFSRPNANRCLMNNRYDAADIEVLSGLDPVKRRPGMYTDTTRPNHLAQEVIDNAVDEALAGHARTIEVVMHADGSCEVSDDGRGMPVDIHPEEGVPGVELILTRLHAGGKFSNKNYTFSGGLHGVGVSVVNALSTRLDVTIKRDGIEQRMGFADGERVTELETLGSVGRRNTGTRLHFWPDPKYFDTPKFNLRALKHLLRAKAVLCPGLTVKLLDEATDERLEWHYADGLSDYLLDELRADHPARELLPPELFVGKLEKDSETVDWAVAWAPDGELVQESYVNLIPTAQHGTHVNGLRSGFTDALRGFCDVRSLLPRGVKLAPEDVWDRVAFVLSVKLLDPQFSGQTKERLSSRQTAGFVEAAAQDAFTLWLNQNVELGDRIAQLAIERRQCAAGARQGLPGDPAPARQDPEHLGGRLRQRAGLAGSARHRRGDRLRSRQGRPERAALRQGRDPGRRGFGRPAHRDLAVRVVPAALPRAGRGRSRIRGDAAAVPHRRGQAGVLRAG